jgi:Competence-damaged protein
MILQGSRLSQQTSERMRRSRSATDAINLSRLAEEALEAAAQTNASIAIAESCTAGKLAALLSEAPGAADRLQGSFVAYTKANKTKSLGVSADLLQRKGAVCREVAIAMAEGALVRSPALGSGRGHHQEAQSWPPMPHRVFYHCFYRTANVTLRTSGP